MRYKQYQNAGVKVSELGIGTWALGGVNFGKVDRQGAISAIHEMIDNGVNLIDTAAVYGNGASEQMVGEALREIPRDQILISTKTGIAPRYPLGTVKNLSYAEIMREVQSSLMNLKTDYLDFYFLHWPDVTTPIGETMDAMNRLKKDGVIRFIGVSNFSIEQIEEAQKYGQIDVQQPPFSMVDTGSLEVIKWGHERGIDSMTYGSLGAGILSGAIRSMPEYDKADYRVTFYDFFREPKFSKTMELLKMMDQIAEKHSRTVAEVAINWSTQKPYIGSALIGARDVRHAKNNCQAFEWKLDAEDMKQLDDELARLGLG